MRPARRGRNKTADWRELRKLRDSGQLRTPTGRTASQVSDVQWNKPVRGGRDAGRRRIAPSKRTARSPLKGMPLYRMSTAKYTTSLSLEASTCQQRPKCIIHALMPQISTLARSRSAYTAMFRRQFGAAKVMDIIPVTQPLPNQSQYSYIRQSARGDGN